MTNFLDPASGAKYDDFDRGDLRRAFGVANEVNEAVEGNDSTLVSRVRVAGRKKPEPASRLRVKRASGEAEGGYREVDEASELFDALGFSREAASGASEVPLSGGYVAAESRKKPQGGHSNLYDLLDSEGNLVWSFGGSGWEDMHEGSNIPQAVIDRMQEEIGRMDTPGGSGFDLRRGNKTAAIAVSGSLAYDPAVDPPWLSGLRQAARRDGR